MKRIELAFLLFALGVLGVVLVHPGIPVGHTLNTRLSERYAVLTCNYLHWDGIHHKNLDMSKEITAAGISVNSNECWRNLF